MAYIVKDNNPQYGGQCYFVGTRKMRDQQGRQCEAADFGDRANAHQFSNKSEATKFASQLNKMGNTNQFTVEEVSIYGQQYGRRSARQTNGFGGFGTLPNPGGRVPQPAAHGGFVFDDDMYGGYEEQGGYNGF